MPKKNKKFYITTAIDYVNSQPHLGHALEKIQADVLARHHRLKGEDVLFLTGTDEHGRKVLEAAEAAKKDAKSFVDENVRKFKELTKILNISNDDFIRTTDKKRHWPAVKKIWLKLKESGDIYKKKYKGLYCSGCEAFITKKDLIDGKCRTHHKEPEIIEEENYFFKLSKYAKVIELKIKNNKLRIVPEARRNEILNFIKQGLEDVSFSRPSKDLPWGIPVPGDKSQTIYVWADALVNYISAIGYSRNSKFKIQNSKFLRYWSADIHVIGKDILRFHATIWPGMLLSIGLELPKTIFVHGFITVGGQKMSKSLGNVIDPIALFNKYGVDVVRYYLLREIPSTEDGDFTYEKFEARYNADLAKGLGNLVARVITLATRLISNFPAFTKVSAGRQFPPTRSRVLDRVGTISKQIPNSKFQAIIKKTWRSYHKALDNFRFNEALEHIWKLISFCDKYIQKEKPWQYKNQETSRDKNQEFESIIHNLLFALINIAWLVEPFLPETSDKIFKQLCIKKSDKRVWTGRFVIRKSAVLFPRIK